MILRPAATPLGTKRFSNKISNKIRHSLGLLLLSASFVFSGSHAFSWGANGHQIVAGVGAALSGVPFWSNNTSAIAQLSTVPDRVWKSTNYQQEGMNHWFQADAYTSQIGKGSLSQFPRSYQAAVSKVGAPVLEKNGVAPWRIQQFYALAFKALKSGNANAAMTYVGVMSHYIGDLSQPLHVSENFDGQQTGQTGIHKFFETDNIQDIQAITPQVHAQALAILQNSSNMNVLMNMSLVDLAFTEIERALMFRDKLLLIDKQFGRTGAGAQQQLVLAISRMADSAAIYAVVLNRLWKAAQVNIPSAQISVGDPSFILDDFSNSLQFTDRKRMTLIDEKLELFADDCDR